MSSKRATALLALIRSYGQEPSDYDEGEEEDPRPYVNGELEPSAWVCITRHGDKTFFLPTFDTADDAMNRAVDYPTDDVWDEIPVAVVNLDTEAMFVPDWRGLPWRRVPGKIANG